MNQGNVVIREKAEATVRVTFALPLSAYERLASLAKLRGQSQAACLETMLRAIVLDGGAVRKVGEGLR